MNPLAHQFRYLKEHPDNPYRLGRHQVPDALTPDKDARRLSAFFGKIQDADHRENVPVFDQGNLGSCTANAALGVLSCDPFFHAGRTPFDEALAVRLYTDETKLDDTQIPGEYPPDDTGSTGIWSMRALEKWGWIDSYVHTRNLHAALVLLNKGPISIGVPWYRSMFEVDAKDFIQVDPASGLAGGHQVAIIADDVTQQAVRVRNSWGTSWGDNGHAWLKWGDLDHLLDSGGDVVQPLMRGVNL